MNAFNKILALIILMLSQNTFAGVAVIVNASNVDAIDGNLIKKIYLGKEKTFPSGEKVTVYTLPSSEADTEYFRDKALSKSNSQFKSYWSKIAFTGKGTPPTEVASNAEMINAIKSDPSSIGFINSNAVTGDVKVVATF